MKQARRLLLAGVLVLLLISGGAWTSVREASAAGGTYVLLGWNDLGMHCYHKDFRDMAVLPPYNTLWVQVVKKGNPPTLITQGIAVRYSFVDNTYSVGKTNFWFYDKALFGVDLAPNVGLKGNGLRGTMKLAGDHFVAEGIPMTEFNDSTPTLRQPYQLARIVVVDKATGVVLARQTVVAPVSSEMRCDRCHNNNGTANPTIATGRVGTNILTLHDRLSGTALMARRPVLCAVCHGSNALGMPGNPALENLSKAMHTRHSEAVPNTLLGCYNCHPGPQTRCLRDVMSTEYGMTCIHCHGPMLKVAMNPNPWLREPRCDGCHDVAQDKPLYRFSKGHAGIYCEGCHDSTHAIAPSRLYRDGIKFTALQGSNGPLSECSVCHSIMQQGSIQDIHAVKSR
jgi:hypothetical protein